jgi:hypothetical protein
LAFAAVAESNPQLDREAATNLRHLVNSNVDNPGVKLAGVRGADLSRGK